MNPMQSPNTGVGKTLAEIINEETYISCIGYDNLIH